MASTEVAGTSDTTGGVVASSSPVGGAAGVVGGAKGDIYFYRVGKVEKATGL
jgi:hypothetical protein